MRIFILLLITATIVSCKQKESTTAGVSTAEYFNYKDSVEAGGVKMIPITHLLVTLKYGPNASEPIQK